MQNKTKIKRYVSNVTFKLQFIPFNYNPYKEGLTSDWLKDLSINEMSGASFFGCCQAQ